ncbi:hypothetical protein MSG28_011722 [Choristoneura fumiferana]|uniref:Uncharacterized protein n=1 Tax=Choristoneura fumiferana TaxID=7141 RepID=A0ACC0KM65_CHOFU|nr:hypothetical protein MSG28_011722 [Choristoneura fumiferana]
MLPVQKNTTVYCIKCDFHRIKSESSAEDQTLNDISKDEDSDMENKIRSVNSTNDGVIQEIPDETKCRAKRKTKASVVNGTPSINDNNRTWQVISYLQHKTQNERRSDDGQHNRLNQSKLMKSLKSLYLASLVKSTPCLEAFCISLALDSARRVSIARDPARNGRGRVTPRSSRAQHATDKKR